MNTIELSKVLPDKNQPRKYFGAEKMASLKASIKAKGIKSPLILQKEGNTYLIVDGERRYRAAKELGLKVVPFALIESLDPVSRLIEQFHIQEQHEGWSPVEKAQVLLDLVEEVKKPLFEVAEMLGINRNTAQRYFAFSKIQNKERFLGLQVSIDFASAINGLKSYVSEIKKTVLGETFNLTEQRKLEKVLLDQIGDGQITKSGDFVRLKDIFKTNPKLIDKYLSGSEDLGKLYVSSKTKSAFHLRNVVASSKYVTGHINAFLENPNIVPSEKDIAAVRMAYKHCEKFLKAVE